MRNYVRYIQQFNCHIINILLQIVQIEQTASSIKVNLFGGYTLNECRYILTLFFYLHNNKILVLDGVDLSYSIYNIHGL